MAAKKRNTPRNAHEAQGADVPARPAGSRPNEPLPEDAAAAEARRHAPAAPAPSSARPASAAPPPSAASVADNPPLPPSSPLDIALRFVVFPALVLLALSFLCIRSIPDPDTWFHMALGREVLDTGSLPRGDLFSHTTPGGEWISSGWGSSVALEWMFRRAGVGGLVWAVFAVEALVFLLIYFVAVLRFRLPGGMVAIFLLAVGLSGYLRFTPRPELGTHLMMVSVMLTLVVAGESKRLRSGDIPHVLWLLPFLFVLWPNLHAGYMSGFVPLTVFLGWNVWEAVRGRSPRRLLVLLPGVPCYVAWAANPYGFRLPALAEKIRAMPDVSESIMEWKPLLAASDPMMPSAVFVGFGLFIVLTLLGIGLSLASAPAGRLRFPWWHAVLIAFFIALAFYQRRHTGLAAMVVTVLMLPHLRAFETAFARVRWVPLAALLAGTAALGYAQHTGALHVGRGLYVKGVQGGLLPAHATLFLQSHRPPETLYNTYGFGAYLLYFLGPETRIFIDGRLDVYDVEVWMDYRAIESGAMPLDAAVAKYGLNTFVLYTKDLAGRPDHLVHRLTAAPDWGLVYFDDVCAVFVRRSARGREYHDTHVYRYATPYAPERLAAVLDDEAKRSAAIDEIGRAMTHSHESGNALALMALAARQLGDPQHALHLLHAALARDPHCLLAQRLLAESAPRP